MKKAVTLLVLALLVASLSSPLVAQKKEPWFHVEVKENKTEPEYVKVNLPMGMVDVALNVIKDKKFKVTASIQGDAVRVASKSKDELQMVMNHLRSLDLGLDLQFTNFK